MQTTLQMMQCEISSDKKQAPVVRPHIHPQEKVESCYKSITFPLLLYKLPTWAQEAFRKNELTMSLGGLEDNSQ